MIVYLFIVESISTMDFICNKEVLYRLLNNNLPSEDRRIIIKYLKKKNLNKNDYKEIDCIVEDKSIAGMIKQKDLTSFKYDKEEYVFKCNDTVLLKPVADGSDLKFSISESIYLYYY